MGRKITWIITALLLCFPTAGWGGGLTIEVAREVLVQGPEITIGDLAEVKGSDPKLVAKVQSIVIGQSPPAGEERLLYGGYISTRLKQYGFNPSTLNMRVPEKIRVTRAFQRVESREIEAVVMKAIREQMTWNPQKTTIREIRGIEPITLPPGPVQYDVTFPTTTDFLGPTSFSLSLRVHGNIEKRLYGTAYIEVIQDVVTVTRPVSKNEVIEEEDIRLKRMNLAQVPKRVITDPEEVIGKRAKRPLQANAMIRPYEVETPPLVQKGDRVVIIVESPLLKITAIGEALERGNRGETIRIRNTSSNREVHGVVIDGKTVRVAF